MWMMYVHLLVGDLTNHIYIYIYIHIVANIYIYNYVYTYICIYIFILLYNDDDDDHDDDEDDDDDDDEDEGQFRSFQHVNMSEAMSNWSSSARTWKSLSKGEAWFQNLGEKYSSTIGKPWVYSV